MASKEALRAYRKINIKSSLIHQVAKDHQRSVKPVVYLTSCTASTVSTGTIKTDENPIARVIFVSLLHQPKRSLKLVSSPKVFKVSYQTYTYRGSPMVTCVG